jgi:pilus assembly protein Flp/PilA
MKVNELRSTPGRVAQALPPDHASLRSREGAGRICTQALRVIENDAPEGRSMEFISRLRSFVRDEEGQDLLEYALLIALIALVCVGAVALAGTKVSQVFTNIAGQIPAGT